MPMELSPYYTDDRLFFIGIALLLNWIIGGVTFRRNTGAVAFGDFLRSLLQNLEAKLNRSSRSSGERTVRGIVVILLMIGLAGFVAAQLSALSATHPWGWLGEAVLLALFIPQKPIWENGMEVFTLLKAKKTAEARKAVSRFSLRDTRNLDDHALIRTTAEHICSALGDRVLSPILWYILLGLPGFILSKILTTGGELLGYDTPRHRAYGFAAGRGEALINWLPAKIAAWLVVLAAIFVPKASPRKGWQASAHQADFIHSPLKGAPIAACAGAFSINLGGPRSVQGNRINDKWVGSGSAKVSLIQLRKILLLYTIACLLILAVIATLLTVL